MTWHLCSVELDRVFVITDENHNTLAYPVTRKTQYLAKWGNKKLKPMTLWKQIADEQEQATVRLMVAAPELLDTLEETLKCLENWMEIAGDEDQRDYDQEAVAKARALIKKIKGS